MYFVDEFVTVTPGEPFRLLPVGRIVKNGTMREVTAALLQKFKLPHFKPPIKLGSHTDTTPAGGHIVGLEVRPDGLYGRVEWNEQGGQALEAGSYRYHSPEIIWEGGLEDPNTGNIIEAPLIVGDALLHTPHLGEATAFYTVESQNGGDPMSENMVTAPASVWERLLERLQPQPPEQPEPKPETQNVTMKVTESEEYTALQKERDEYAAKIAKLEAAQQHAARVESFAAEFKETVLSDDADLHQLLADLPEDKVKAVVVKFKGLAAQAQAGGLDNEIGGNPAPDSHETPAEQLHQLIAAYTAEKGVSYNEARTVIANDPKHRALWKAYEQGGK